MKHLNSACGRYKYEVVHVSLLQVVHDGVLGDLGQQHHVVHTALLHVLTLPVVLRLRRRRERERERELIE